MGTLSRRYPRATAEQAIALLRAGLLPAAVAGRLGVPVRDVNEWVRRDRIRSQRSARP